MRKLFRAWILPALFLSACSSGRGAGGTETGNTTQLTLQVIGYQSSRVGASASPALTTGSLNIDTAKIVLDRLTFIPEVDCGTETAAEPELRFDGPFVVDLLNPAAVSGLENLSVPAGLYCRIKLVFKKLENPLPPGIAPSDPIVNRSILIEGARQDGVPFQMTTEIDEEFELDSAAGFAIEQSPSLQNFFIAFDLDQWFGGVDLMGTFVEISTGGNGAPIILINDTKNQNIQEQIEENIKHSADLFKDSDDNDSLDPEELDNPLANGTSVP